MTGPRQESRGPCVFLAAVKIKPGKGENTKTTKITKNTKVKSQEMRKTVNGNSL